MATGTCSENLVKLGHVVFENRDMHEDRRTNSQTDRQTDAYDNTMLPYQGLSNNAIHYTRNNDNKSCGTMRHVRSGKNTRWK